MVKDFEKFQKERKSVAWIDVFKKKYGALAKRITREESERFIREQPEVGLDDQDEEGEDDFTLMTE
jgi:hypothetical protein